MPTWIERCIPDARWWQLPLGEVGEVLCRLAADVLIGLDHSPRDDSQMPGGASGQHLAGNAQVQPTGVDRVVNQIGALGVGERGARIRVTDR